MNLQAAPDYFELADYTGVLRRRWKKIALVTLVGLALAAAYVVLAPRTYTATVLIQVNALPDNANAVGGRTGGPVNMDNEGQVVKSTAVAAQVKKILHSSLSATDISQNIHVTVPPNSTFLQVTCSASSALGAQRCANATAAAYLEYRRTSIQKLLGAGIDALEKQAAKLRFTIENLKGQLYSTRHKKNITPGSPVIIGDQLRLSSAQTQLSAVQAHISVAVPLYASVSVPDSTVMGTISSPATLPTSPSSPRKLLFVPSGLIVGLVVGVAWAFIAERRDKRVHTVRDVERFGGVPTLIHLDAKGQGPVTGLESPRSAAGRAFAELAQIAEAELGESGHVLAVAATSPGSSASAVAVNVAAALSRGAGRTVLICADLHGTRVPEMLGTGRGRGLSEVLTGAARANDVLIPVADLPMLRVVTPGFDIARGAAAIQQSQMRHAVGELLSEARYVVIEVQSAGENSDTFSVAHLAEAAIVAAEIGRTKPQDLADCASRLERLGTRVLGTAILPAGPVFRRAKGAQPPPAAPPPQESSYAGSISRYEMQQAKSAAGQDQAAADRTAPAQGPSGTQSAGPAPVWTAGAPKVSGREYTATSTSAPRGLKETAPMPRVQGGEHDAYPNPADPATGD